MPPISFEPTPAYERTQAASADQEADSATRSASAAPPGYDLRDEVGRGGMGIVFRAFDLSLNREVAVKLLQDQFPATGTTAARFLDEARITAQLQHPGIPAVHQVGMLATGRPYLAMKLIKGETLDSLLKERTDFAAERSKFVDIFEDIAQALGYAHSRHVIHRDLKPANVMVGAFREVQVMDWGLAKVLAEPVSPGTATDPNDTTTHIRSDRESDSGTQYGQFMGTPAFMPPEQAIGAVDQIDARSDVFGLGAILCVILTGKPPFVGGDAETTRQLAARGKTDDAFERLDACGAEPELIAIAKRCLAVDPSARPANAGELAAAVAEYRAKAEERVRNLELARAAGLARRRILYRAAAAIFAVLLAGIGASAWQAVRATKAEQDTAAQLLLTKDAEAKEREAREEADRQARAAVDQKFKALEGREEALRQKLIAERVKGFLQDVISQASPWDQLTRTGAADPNLTIGEALERSTRDLGDRFRDEPAIEAELRISIGSAYLDMSDFPKARLHLERAVELQRRSLGEDALQLLNLPLMLGDAYRKQGLLREAEAAVGAVVKRREAVFGRAYPPTLDSVKKLAFVRDEQGRYAESAALYRRVAGGLELANGFEDRGTLDAWMGLADSLRNLGELAEAKAIFTRVIAGWEKTAGPEHPSTSFALNGLALVYQHEREFERAEQLFLRAATNLEKSLGRNHNETLVARQNLGSFYRATGQLGKAETALLPVLEARERHFGPDQPQTLFLCNHVAMLRDAQGRRAEAEPLYRRAIDGLRRAYGPTHPETLYCETNLAEMYRFAGRYAEAEPLYDRVLEAKRLRYGPDDYQYLYALNNVGTLREAQGRYAEAESIFRTCIPALKRAVGEDHRDTMMALFNLGYVFMSQNRFADAEPWLRESYVLRERKYGFENGETLQAVNLLLLSQESQGKYAEAVPLLRKLLAYREKNEPVAWLVANTRSRLGRALLDVGLPGEARKLALAGFEGLKAKESEIPPFYRGLRLREAAGRLAKIDELTGSAEDAAKWKAVEAGYRELAPFPRVRN